jgi:hypothetical protein
MTTATKIYHVDLMNDDEGMFGGMTSGEIEAVDAKASVAEFERMISEAVEKALPEVELEHHFGPYGGASIVTSHLTSETTLSDEEAISEEISEIVGAIYEKGEFWQSNF